MNRYKNRILYTSFPETLQFSLLSLRFSMDRYTPLRAIEVVDLGRYGAPDLILLESSFSLQEI